MIITKEIYKSLQQNKGSRFLRYSAKSEAWEEITEIVARDKISHALRFARLKQNRQQRHRQGKEYVGRKEEQQQRTKSICSGNEKNTTSQCSSTFSWMSSYSLGDMSGLATETTPLISSKEEEKPHRISTATFDASNEKNQTTGTTNPSMIRFLSDPGPMIGSDEKAHMMNLFVQQQQSQMREVIESKTVPLAATCVKVNAPIISGEDDFPSKIIDEEKSDLMMREPLLDMDDFSTTIEKDCSNCSSDMFGCSIQFDSEDCSSCSSDIFDW